MVDKIFDGKDSQQRGSQHRRNDPYNNGGKNRLRYGSDEGCRKGCREHLALDSDVDDASTLTHDAAQRAEDQRSGHRQGALKLACDLERQATSSSGPAQEPDDDGDSGNDTGSNRESVTAAPHKESPSRQQTRNSANEHNREPRHTHSAQFLPGEGVSKGEVCFA